MSVRISLQENPHQINNLESIGMGLGDHLISVCKIVCYHAFFKSKFQYKLKSKAI